MATRRALLLVADIGGYTESQIIDARSPAHVAADERLPLALGDLESDTTRAEGGLP